MLEELREQVGTAGDRSEAFKKLLGAAEPLLVLHLYDSGEDPAGEVWIQGGETIIAASVGKSGHTGLLALLELLASKCPRFDVLTATGEPPGQTIHVSIEDLLSDEPDVIEKLKASLWPLSNNENISKQGTGPAEESSETTALQGPAPEETDLPIFGNKDHIAARRQAEIAAARQSTSAAEPAPSNNVDKFALITDRDDLAEVRRRDLETALTAPEDSYPSTPSVPREEMDEPPPVGDVPDTPAAPVQVAVKADATADAAGINVEAPQAEADYLSPPRQQSTRDTVRKLRTLSSVQAALKADSAVAEPIAANSLAPASITMTHWIAGGVLVLALPLVALISIEMTLNKRHQSEDAESVLMQLHRPLEESVTATIDAPLPFHLPDIHSPFRPPEVEAASEPAPSASDTGQKPVSNDEDDVAKLEKSLKWQPPAHRSPPLKPDQISYVEQEAHKGEVLALNGHLDQAASVYSDILVQYPRYAKLRIATISTYMKLKNYSYARKLALDGMRKAERYSDYVIFVNLLHNIAESSTGSTQ